MGLRGPKPRPRESIQWSAELAYAIGLIATDGCLYKDGRHINFTTKDLQLAEVFKKCLGINNKIGKKYGSYSKHIPCHIVQFGDVSFYQFLLGIGITPAKSKTIGPVFIPDKYLADFIRGLFDGDGSSYSYSDPRWPTSFLLYTAFCSASKSHLEWLRNKLVDRLGINGHGVKSTYNNSVYQLKYAKNESRKLIKFMYYKDGLPCLERKRQKIYNALEIADSKI